MRRVQDKHRLHFCLEKKNEALGRIGGQAAAELWAPDVSELSPLSTLDAMPDHRLCPLPLGPRTSVPVTPRLLRHAVTVS